VLGAAFLQKHAAIAPALVVGCDLLWHRRPELWRLAVGWLAVAGTVMVAADVASGGAFRLNVFGALAQPQGWRMPVTLLQECLWAGVASFVGAAVAWWAAPRERTGLWRAYFAVALGVAWLTSFKAGSWTNYYIESFAAACVLAGLMWDVPRSRVRTLWLLVALVSATAWLTFRLGHRSFPVPEDPAAWEQLATRLQALGRPLLVESTEVEFCGTDEPFMANVASFGRMARRGGFDGKSVEARIARREFAAVVALVRLEKGTAGEPCMFPAEWLPLIRQHYRLTTIWPGRTGVPTQYIYQPVQRLDTGCSGVR
jgi:hypothetical protein